jgi:hypothetical protein
MRWCNAMDGWDLGFRGWVLLVRIPHKVLFVRGKHGQKACSRQLFPQGRSCKPSGILSHCLLDTQRTLCGYHESFTFIPGSVLLIDVFMLTPSALLGSTTALSQARFLKCFSESGLNKDCILGCTRCRICTHNEEPLFTPAIENLH